MKVDDPVMSRFELAGIGVFSVATFVLLAAWYYGLLF